MNHSRRRFLYVGSGLMLPLAGLRSDEDPREFLFPGSPVKPKRLKLGLEDFTPQSENASKMGTAWLMSALNADGGIGQEPGQESDIGCTAITGLALMAQGTTASGGAFSRELRRITNFILGAVAKMPKDDITAQTSTQLQRKIGRHAHSFFAATLLAQAFGENRDPFAIQRALRKVTDAITRAQEPEGNWPGESWAPTLGTVMGWVSLRAATIAEVKVASNAERTADYLVRTMQSSMRKTSGSWMHTLYKNATGIRVLNSIGRGEEEIAKKAFADVRRLITKDDTPFTQAGGEEYLAFHLITETMLQKGGKDWKEWFPSLRDKIVKVQNKDGSWTGHHCITSRTFCTAASVLCLSAPFRYLPISQQK